VPYRVRLTGRAQRDLEAIFEFIEADCSEKVFAWFNKLSKAIYSLERLAERGAAVAENRRFRQLLFGFGTRASTYRIIYAVEKRNRVVNVLHIRHGARAALAEGRGDAGDQKRYR
jgi:plasmid stabilization system protein ParE